jgi:transcriptional regulator with XRE-family HTH domain
MRLRRNILGLSQEKLGEAIGLNFQQVQKYERGAHRVGVCRLREIARVLDVPIGFFFDDIDPMRSQPILDLPEAAKAEFFQLQEASELLVAYYEISDAKLRRRLGDLAKALAAEESEVATTTPRPKSLEALAKLLPIPGDPSRGEQD